MDYKNYNKRVQELREAGSAKADHAEDAFSSQVLNAEYNLSFLNEIHPVIPVVEKEAKEHLNYVQSYGMNALASEHFYTRRNSLSSYMLLLTHTGEGELIYEGRKYSLREGDCALVDCEKEHFYKTVSPTGWEISLVHFYGKHLRYPMELWASYHQAVVNIKSQPLFLPVLTAIGESCRESTISNVLNIDCSLSYLVCVLITTVCQETISNYPQRIRNVCSFIDQQYGQDLSLETIAENNYISKYYLSREFRKYTGQTPMQYLKNVRLLHAKYMLLNTDLSIQDIAEKVGFAYSNYFQIVFKAEVGMTPNQYRKQQRGMTLRESETVIF